MTDPRFLLDSNILIYLVAGGLSTLKSQVESLETGSLATSSIAYAEVTLGARRLGVEPQVEALRDILAVLPFGLDAALVYASLPFKRGRFDRLIAAHSLSLGLTLVTNNERDFADIPGLKIENWTK